MCSIQAFVLCDWTDAMKYSSLFVLVYFVCLFRRIGLRRSVGSKYFITQCLLNKIA